MNGVITYYDSDYDEDDLNIMVKWENGDVNSYNDKDLFISKNKKSMAKSVVKLGEGMYFTATYNRKKIRGMVYDSAGDLYLCVRNGKEEADDDTFYGFPSYIHIGDKYDNHDELLKNAKINNFVECKDKRQKAIIDTDKSVKFNDWVVTRKGNKVVFGCGMVKLTIAQIEGWLEYKKKIEDYNIHSLLNNIASVEYIEDLCMVDVNKLRELVDYLKFAKTHPAAKIYNKVRGIVINTHEMDYNDFEDIDIEDVEELLEKINI